MRTDVTRVVSRTYGGRDVFTWCPGCERLHPFRVADEDGTRPSGSVWEWDGDEVTPTFSPSLLVYGSVHLCGRDVRHYLVCADPDACGQPGHYVSPEGPAHVQPCENYGNCHSFLRAGQWEFLGDSAHGLAGQTVPMEPLPDSWQRGER